ncbi:MAG: hypothetical protein M1829_001636 [Trizodia sp. TS-e1964]|nr:MAG: hypothetical protein M1829_001636 [Trizodia sp. TS-e1964]
MPKRQRNTILENGADSASVASAPNSSGFKGAFAESAPLWTLEQDYEQRPRKTRKRDKESSRLPIRTADGVIREMRIPATVKPAENSDVEWSAEESEVEAQAQALEIREKPAIPIRQQIIEAKEELAKIASHLTEDPEENVGLLRSLSQIASSPVLAIQTLALVTQLAVYRDLIPGYRIRPASEDELKVKISKEVRQLRNFEQALVGGYQGYVRELSRLAKLRRSRAGESASIATAALSCACGLLVAVPHFNFRGEVLKILINKLSGRVIDEDFLKCAATIETLFTNDEDGTSSMEAVSLLTRMMKSRSYRVDERVLNTFLHLRLLSEFSSKGSQNRIDKLEEDQTFRGKKLKDVRKFRTKRERKLVKERKAVAKEMKEADATVSHEERDKMQAETLKMVFVTYFRILKARTPSLMGAVLEGLAKFAHLINQDFFGDLLEALKDLIRHTESASEPDGNEDDTTEEEASVSRNTSRESLLCITTAFALLEGQEATKAASSLNLDLSFFITQLYRSLYNLSLNPDIELSTKSLHLPDPNTPTPPPANSSSSKVNVQITIVLLLRCLSHVLLPHTAIRSVPPMRIAAFSKQLLTSTLHLPEKSSLATLDLLGRVIKTHGRKIGSLWNTEERRGNGVFEPLGGEVESCNPFAATVWEGELLRLHFSPAVREGIKGVERGVLKCQVAK